MGARRPDQSARYGTFWGARPSCKLLGAGSSRWAWQQFTVAETSRRRACQDRRRVAWYKNQSRQDAPRPASIGRTKLPVSLESHDWLNQARAFEGGALYDASTDHYGFAGSSEKHGRLSAPSTFSHLELPTAPTQSRLTPRQSMQAAEAGRQGTVGLQVHNAASRLISGPRKARLAHAHSSGVASVVGMDASASICTY